MLLDRNIGATSDDKADLVNTYGLKYQWGRKDPFTGSSSRSANTEKQIYLNGSLQYHPKSAASTIEFSIQHPETYLTGSQWLTGDRNDFLWGNPYGYNYNAAVPYSSTGAEGGTVVKPSKSIYDPCPVGYMVPANRVENFDTRGKGADGGYNFYTLTENGGPTSWFPYCGTRKISGSVINIDAGCGNYYSSSPSTASGNVYYLDLYDWTVRQWWSFSDRANGLAIRCMKIREF